MTSRFPIAAELVMQLRKLTGYGVVQCKRILEHTGSIEGAIAWIEEQKRSGIYVAQSVTDFCPECGNGLSKISLNDCDRCDWVRFRPTDRARWGNAGKCPNCSFEFRWDGSICSHCGHGVDSQTS